MALYNNSGVSTELIKQVAIPVSKHLKGKCRFCPRAFERGEKIVFGMIKNIQMKWLEEDIEQAEPAGFGEQHSIELINAHLSCAIANADKFRSVTDPR